MVRIAIRTKAAQRSMRRQKHKKDDHIGAASSSSRCREFTRGDGVRANARVTG